jgi:hypothetical protein
MIERSAWHFIIREMQLSNDAQTRLLQVLTVLISSELITDVTEEEFAPLLRAIAVAVQ